MILAVQRLSNVKEVLVMPLPKEQHKYTVDDILALPDDQRAELIWEHRQKHIKIYLDIYFLVYRAIL